MKPYLARAERTRQSGPHGQAVRPTPPLYGAASAGGERQAPPPGVNSGAHPHIRKFTCKQKGQRVWHGELYRKSDITVGMTTVVMNLRSRLLAMPNKLAANIAKLDGDEGKIMDLLQSSLYEIMEEFSNYQVALQPPKDDEEDEQDGEETG